MFEVKKIGIVKRASALLLDVILLMVLATGFMFLISLICNYDHEEQLSTEYFNEWEDFRREYISGVATFYGFTYEVNGDSDYTITKNGEQSSLAAVMEKLDASKGNDIETAEAYAKYLELTPAGVVNQQYQLVTSLLFTMISIGTLLAYLVLEFIVPIILKDGQTVGKKVFGIAVVRYDCVKVSNISLFTRAVLGKYAIETMFPILLVFLFLFVGIGLMAVILFVAILFLNALAFFGTKNNTPIHDLIAGTVAVDAKLQMIYASEEELIEKKAEAQKMNVEKEYKN